MKKKLVSLIFFLMLIISNPLATAFQNFDERNYHSFESKKIYVDNNNINGPWDGSINNPFKLIRDGINFSSDGSIIHVLNGEYFENIIINKSIMSVIIIYGECIY